MPAMQSTADTDCRVFALIIGINKYKAIRGLKGCVNDATAFRDFLKRSLHVPDSHIEFIADESATRFNIIQKFQTHLINNSKIRDHGGDTLIFFYAGHGSRVEAPNNMFSTDGHVEIICPHDEDGTDENGEYIHGIPDYTIHKLFQNLAAAKGNNLTAIFDSCNSGGIGRSNLTPRFAEIHVPIPSDLDADLVGSRAAKTSLPHGFGYPFMESHILLAACRQDQIAYEATTAQGVHRGRFSEKLIRTLRTISLHKTTYMDLIDLIQNWTDQDPQVEGTHKTRFLFNRTYPTISQKALPVMPTPGILGSFEIKMGSIEGVVPGTEFLVNDASNHTVCFLYAHSVDLQRSILVAKNSNETPIEIPSGSKATVSNWNNTEIMMKVFIALDFDPAAIACLFPELTSQLKSLPTIPRKFVQELCREKADIELKKLADDKFAIERLNGAIKEYAPQSTEFSLKPDNYNRLPMIMEAVSHFNHFLHIHHGSDPLPTVTLEMHSLTGSYPRRQPSADLFVNGIAEVKDDKDMKYGFTICNRSDYDLFPYLFFFDPTQYVIDVWYSPQWSKMKPPLDSSPNPNGIEATRFPIGYGVGGYAFEFSIPPGMTADTGFLKVFVSTEYFDMDWIAQKSPFDLDFLPSGRLGGGRQTVEKGQAWDAFWSVVTVRA
ncbi:caspase domain-containing protein [Mycena galopus ATCC 62051]|nr:caspase domain-containing protein [Mycena galopus ATCC 62051]